MKLKKLRKTDPRQCMSKVIQHITDDKKLDMKFKDYNINFGCNENSIEDYCKNEDSELHQWKNKLTNKPIDLNSSNTEESCDLLEFLNTQELVNNRYGSASYDYAFNAWLNLFSGNGPMPRKSTIYYDMTKDNPDNDLSLCIYTIDNLLNEDISKNDWVNVLTHGLFKIPTGADPAAPLAYCANYNKNLTDIII